MDRIEFIEKVNTMGIQCIILDDDLINPNEIIVFTRKKKAFLKKMEKQREMSVVTKCERKRYIRVVSYKETGLKSWEKGLKASGKKAGESVTVLDEEDCAAVYSYYAFVYVQTENWLYHNILHILKTRLGLLCEEDLKGWLADYIKRKNYGIEVKNIVNVPQQLLGLLSPLARKKLVLNQFRLKVIRKLVIKRLWRGSKKHHRSTRKEYLEYLVNSSGVGTNWSVINAKGASASVFVKDIQGENAYFVKGNEMADYRGITNEIFIQKRLLEHAEDVSWFLPMYDCDKSGKWIRYEYVTWPLLSQYVEDKGLSQKELDLLGDYLVRMLDKLFSMNIVHNDLRGDNLMVKTKEDGTLDGFVLIDFGCASYNGSVPWKRNSFLGRYLEKNGCGRMRYSEVILDDAASAMLVYLNAGGKPEDETAGKLRERIGRLYFLCNGQDK